MFCVECGKEIPNGVKFCPECGASQIVKVEEKPAKAKPKKKAPKKGKRYYSKLSVPELKKILREKKLPVGGVKGELIERLISPNWKEKQSVPWSKRLDVKLEKEKKEKRRRAFHNKYHLNQPIVHDNALSSLLGIAGGVFFLIALYYIDGIGLLEEGWMCHDGGRWRIDDTCGEERVIVLGCLIMGSICFVLSSINYRK